MDIVVTRDQLRYDADDEEEGEIRFVAMQHNDEIPGGRRIVLERRNAMIPLGVSVLDLLQFSLV